MVLARIGEGALEVGRVDLVAADVVGDGLGDPVADRRDARQQVAPTEQVSRVGLAHDARHLELAQLADGVGDRLRDRVAGDRGAARDTDMIASGFGGYYADCVTSTHFA